MSPAPLPEDCGESRKVKAWLWNCHIYVQTFTYSIENRTFFFQLTAVGFAIISLCMKNLIANILVVGRRMGRMV